MKADLRFAAESFAGQHHDRSDPADHRDVTEQRRVAVADSRHQIGNRTRLRARAAGRAGSLAGSALPAELIRGTDVISALDTERHRFYLFLRYVNPSCSRYKAYRRAK